MTEHSENFRALKPIIPSLDPDLGYRLPPMTLIAPDSPFDACAWHVRTETPHADDITCLRSYVAFYRYYLARARYWARHGRSPDWRRKGVRDVADVMKQLRRFTHGLHVAVYGEPS